MNICNDKDDKTLQSQARCAWGSPRGKTWRQTAKVQSDGGGGDGCNNSGSMDGFFRVQGESLDSVPDAWRLLCHTYGR